MAVLYGEPDVGNTTIKMLVMSVLGIEACSFRGMRWEYFVRLASQMSLGLKYDYSNKERDLETPTVWFLTHMQLLPEKTQR